MKRSWNSSRPRRRPSRGSRRTSAFQARGRRPARSGSSRRRASAASSARVRRVGEQPREQRVEVGARPSSGASGARSRRAPGPRLERTAHCARSDVTDVDAALVLHQVDDAAVGAHLQPVERAGRGEHRMPGELRRACRRSSSRVPERLAARDAVDDRRLVEHARLLAPRRAR